MPGTHGIPSRKKASRRRRNAPQRAVTVTVNLHPALASKFLDQAAALRLSEKQNAELLIDNGVAPSQLTNDRKLSAAVNSLASILGSLPSVEGAIGVSPRGLALWWLKFIINTQHELAWHVIQRLSYVLNYYCLEAPFFVRFYPVSPPPALNGGPHEFLSWVIEAQLRYVDPRPIAEALRLELPRRPKDADAWRVFD